MPPTRSLHDRVGFFIYISTTVSVSTMTHETAFFVIEIVSNANDKKIHLIVKPIVFFVI